MNKISLPALPFDYKALEPIMSAEVLTLHHDKHHQAYVDGANKILEALDAARTAGAKIDLKAALKELSFHLGGHALHSLFWSIMQAPMADNVPQGKMLELINEQFGSWPRFQEEFALAATSVEGSGWAVLFLEPEQKQLLIGQIEKHNLNVYPGFKPLLALDVWEHAYYLDYKNNRAEFVTNFWQLVNWPAVAERLG
jgi:Fe-Mn family superoxide dismutase